MQAADFCADQDAVADFCFLLAQHMFGDPYVFTAQFGTGMVKEEEQFHSIEKRLSNGQVGRPSCHSASTQANTRTPWPIRSDKSLYIGCFVCCGFQQLFY